MPGRTRALTVEQWGELTRLRRVIPAGGYAVWESRYRFYRVRKPQHGRWSGYTFLDEQSSDDYYPVTEPKRQLTVLRLIGSAPPSESARLYGQQIGRCAVCGRTLTSEESRSVGIGPYCAERMTA